MDDERDRPLRIGGVPYLNGQPLTAWFQSPECDMPVEYVADAPSRLVEMLADGQLDVALASSIEAIRNPRVLALPGMCIGCNGPVRSVRIFSRVPVHRIRSLAADQSSLTSVALAQGLMKEFFELTVNVRVMPPDPERMLRVCDAALLIGDRALIGVEAPYTLDLGQAWKELTGLPFVFALWLVNDEAQGLRAHSVLSRAYVWGDARREELARAWSAATGMSDRMAIEYLTGVMQYNLGVEECTALDRFAHMCHSVGLCASSAGVRFVPVGRERLNSPRPQ